MTSAEINQSLKQPPVRPVSAIYCYVSYISALGIGILTWWLFQRYNLVSNRFYIALIANCVATTVVWIFSIINNNSSIYDPYWVIAPPILALGMIFSGGVTSPWSFRHIIIVVCLFLWAARYHIFYRWTGWRTGLQHEDWRYEMMRSFPVPYWLNSLLGMHLFPTVLVYFAFAPGILALSIPAGLQSSFSVFDGLGIATALIAVLILYFSDRQLGKFRSTEEYKKGGIFRKGLWKYSRHPNYFGEVLFWISMMFFGIAVGLHKTAPVLVFVGPAVMAAFFRFSSWLMDVRSLERRPKYKQVMEEVSAMIPWFPKIFPKRKTKE
jgi:steroid 5-alpha reductase family enzyme